MHNSMTSYKLYDFIDEPQNFIDEPQRRSNNTSIMPNALIEAVDFTSLGVVSENNGCVPKFIEGENYIISSVKNGIEIQDKIYKLIKVVDFFNGIKIDSVIVKQISGQVGKIFSLSQNDCELHNISYVEGLQLFPKSLPWKRVKTRVHFDPRDLSTTPVSEIDNTIRCVLLKLSGFGDYYDNKIITPFGKIIDEKIFKNSLTVYSREPVVYGNGFVWEANKPFNAYFVKPNNKLFNHGNFISSDGEIFLKINLAIEDFKGYNIDGYFGVEPIYLKDINPSKFFIVSWDDSNSKLLKDVD